ncbi:MAG: hypothetical protein EXQ48_07385 [Acidobacteria bacterium]|nr:hypothetical protein [Acidobacteriota bacterium]
MKFMRCAVLTLLIALPLLGAGCDRNVEVEKVLKITDLHTGWYDAGIVEGSKNKLVPSVSFRLGNVSNRTVASVQINAIFKQVTGPEPWGEHFVRAIGTSGLGAGATSGAYVLRSNLGYTGTESRMQLLRNSAFVDARVEIFAKHGARTWVKIGDIRIDRQLLTQ